MILNLYKNRGETPLECLERFRLTEKGKDIGKMTYLGRLDPLAEGVLLVGSGEDTSQERREGFFGLDKEYEFTAIFGFATDTYDVMGKIISPPAPSYLKRGAEEIKEMDLIKICKIFEGEREQEYPKYSSKMISSRESFSSEKSSDSLASLGQTFSTENFPSKKINIYKLEFKKLDFLSNKELFGRLLMDISRVKGDFRQAEILELWKDELLSSTPLNVRGERGDILLGFFSAKVSSGTYIRSLVNDMGQTLGIGATTLSIKRTRVGDYKIEDSLKF